MHQNKFFPLAFAILLSVFFLFWGILAMAAGNADEKASFAKMSLEKYVNNALSEKNIGNFGFKSLSDARKAELGKSYPVISLDLQVIKNYQSGEKVASLKSDTDTTWYQVISSGGVVAKLEIIDRDNRMIAGDFGAASEAKRISQFIDKSSQMLTSSGIRQSGSMKILKIPYMKAAFVYIESSKGEYLVPAMPLPGRYEMENGELYPAEEALMRMKEYAQQIEEGMIR